MVFRINFTNFTRIQLFYHTKTFIWVKLILTGLDNGELSAEISTLDRVNFYMWEKNNCCFPHFIQVKCGPKFLTRYQYNLQWHRPFLPYTSESKAEKSTVRLCICNSHFHSCDRPFPSTSWILAWYQVLLECQIESRRKTLFIPPKNC